MRSALMPETGQRNKQFGVIRLTHFNDTVKLKYPGHDTHLLFSAHSLSAGSGATQANFPF